MPEDWSRTGRRSRRKGKTFERDVAAFVSRMTGLKWQTSRNSGRTDIEGDVYLVDHPYQYVIECKNRQSLGLKQLFRPNGSYRNLSDQIDLMLKNRPDSSVLVFIKDEYGMVWVCQWSGRPDEVTRSLCESRMRLTDFRGRTWASVTAFKQ